ncbi:MAG: DUF4176 domain-containing protein [Clostridia bacterium]|nr:DUF4176 domain-containing protein [Clostridia bacterium]
MKIHGLLPIGSVVLLKESTKKMMIIGFLQQQESGMVWDYVGLPFPEGFLGGDRTYLFNHTQIESIYALGYQDTEQLAYAAHLEEAADEIRKARAAEK